ncbi:MAG: hypothetical protein KIS92_04900 [Planctomycetota bacterium]|nr:hypothetical protein [Planctomycetota bacterium]
MEMQSWLTKVHRHLEELQSLDLGFPLGRNIIRPPQSKKIIEDVLLSVAAHASLFPFYECCDGINLPDVHVGYFLHTVNGLLPKKERNEPAILGGEFGGAINIIGSTGGGGYFVMRKQQGDVFYLPTGPVVNEIYDASSTKVRSVGSNMHDFLDALQRDISAFIIGKPDHTYMV